MSSRTGKNKANPSDAFQDPYQWSDWSWDAEGSFWFRFRLNSSGQYVYDYSYEESNSADASIPRSAAEFNPTNTFVSGQSTSSESSNREYNYSQQSSDINSLADNFSNTSINDGSPGSSNYPNQYNKAVSFGSSGVNSATNFPLSGSARMGGYTNPSTGGFVSMQAGTDDFYQSQSTSNYDAQRSYSQVDSGSQQRRNSGEGSSSGAITPTQTSYKTIQGTSGKEERLDPRFKVHKSRSFIPGKVFKVLWSEPQGTTQSNNTEVTSFTLEKTKHGEKVYSSIRRFVIVATGQGYSQCVPILTYGHQATKKFGINRDDHAIIYMGDTAPKHVKDEPKLSKKPIHMNGNSPRDKLGPDSRINYGKIYTVEHNVKVLFIGQLTKDSERKFNLDFQETQDKMTRFEE